MNKKDVDYIHEKLAVLNNEPLRFVFREGDSIFIEFGELVERGTDYFAEDGNAAARKEMSGKYSLYIDCSPRFICGNQVVLGKRDLYNPTEEQQKKEDFDWNLFDWVGKGNNRFDEISEKYFATEKPEFIVEKISVNRLGDLNIAFINGFKLEVIINVSNEEECWRFFETGDEEDNDLVITGLGVYVG